MSILDTIVDYKKKELESTKELITLEEIMKSPHYTRKPLSMRASIEGDQSIGIIAEFKRKSPSKGIINDKAAIVEVAKGYENAGASAISVLTDFNFFGGSVDDLQKARDAVSLPILRKEFIIDQYQVHEAKAIGADAILLIASVLNKDEVKDLARLAHEIGLEVLLEIHDEDELECINENIDIVGVNNRNLKTFEVDLQRSVELAMKIPGQFLKISESGIASTQDVEYLRQEGFRGFLIGENFMATTDPVSAFSVFVKALNMGGLAV